MWLRSNPDRVECRFGGEHVASSARLRVVTARFSAYVRSLQFTRDGEARFWLGWGPEDAMRQLPPTPLPSDPLLLDPAFLGFMAMNATTGREVAWIVLRRGPDGAYEVGGMVDHEARGQGYGREALETVCSVAHHHFGISRLVAGCEMTNLVSQRWLRSCGFDWVAGPPQHTLPNGRVIDSLWWQRVDTSAKRRCRARV